MIRTIAWKLAVIVFFGLLGIIALLFLGRVSLAVHFFLDPHEESLHELRGLTSNEVETLKGEPDFTEEFALKDDVNPFRIELLNFFPRPVDPLKIRIKESRWKFSSYTEVAWFQNTGGEWLVIDAFRHSNSLRY